MKWLFSVRVCVEVGWGGETLDFVEKSGVCVWMCVCGFLIHSLIRWRKLLQRIVGCLPLEVSCGVSRWPGSGGGAGAGGADEM